MDANDFLQHATNLLFVAVFLYSVYSAIRRPTRVKFDTALFFGVAAWVIFESWVASALDIELNRFMTSLTLSGVMAMPYLLLRLLNDVAVVPWTIMRASELGLALSVVALFVFAVPFPGWLTAILLIYFVAVLFYGAWVTIQVARGTGGVTKRRAQAVAAGSALLGLGFVLSGILSAIPEVGDAGTIFQRLLTLAAGLAYFVGFATPRFLRNAWQEPELRAFLARASELPRLPDTATIVRELERGASSSLGAPDAAIGLWDDETQRIRYSSGDGYALESGEMIAGRSFAQQRPIFSQNASRDDPQHEEVYRAAGATAVLAAPITAGERRLGVLAVYAPRAPIFADDDLELVQLLADQAAVILESRALIDEASRVRAREEATRLKDDFLSAAAHDLKTPLTALVMQTQLLERRTMLHPEAPADLDAIRRVIEQARRLRNLVLELLDASRVEYGKLTLTLEDGDLTRVVEEVLSRIQSENHTIAFEHNGPVVGTYDRSRMAQVIENLLENAVKYSPKGGDVRVTVWGQHGEAHLTVSDSGIGIPADDLPHIFDRFHRGGNVDDRRFLGLGLGLYICRGIVEQHAGRIWATSQPGRGSTFHVVLPAGRSSGDDRQAPDSGRR